MPTRWIAPWMVVTCALSIELHAAGNTLTQAVRANDAARVQVLLRERVDLNAATPDGATALHWAARANSVEIMELLLRGGAKPNAVNVYGITPLALACLNAGTGAVDALLRAGADPNLASVSGETPLMTASRTGNVNVVKALVAAGAVVDARQESGQTALMWAAAEAHADIVKELLRAGAVADVESKTKFTALMFAAQSGDVESVRALLAAGAEGTHVAADKRDALIIAAGSGHTPVVELLLSRGSDPNVADNVGMTPLHEAVWGKFNNLEMIELLLAHKANPNARATGFVPQRLWYKYFADIFYRIPEFFNMKGATPMALAAAQGDASAMRALAKGGADVSITLDNGSTPLMLAAGLGWTVEQSNVSQERAVAAVQAALDLGADINARNKGGRTAMHGAANQGVGPVLRLLAARGADINALDSDGWSPLWTAEHAYLGSSVLEQPESISTLRELGAKELPPATATDAQKAGSASR